MAMKEAYSFTLIGRINREKLQKICKKISYAAYDTFEDIDATIMPKNQKLILTVKHLKGKVIHSFVGHNSIEANLKKKGLNVKRTAENSFKLYI